MAGAKTKTARPSVAGALALALASSTVAPTSRADEPSRATPIDDLAPHLGHAFTGVPLALELSALALTPTLIATGADDATRRAFLGRSQDAPYSKYAVDAGWIAPAAVPIVTFTVGALVGGVGGGRARTMGAASIQAVVITISTVFTLKWLTGRPFPSPVAGTGGNDAWHSDDPGRFTFQPFTLDRGTAWPSGHASGAFALASSLTAASFGDHVGARAWIVGVASYGFATSISAGMLIGQHHWLSDVVAGALFGQAIGWSIGRDFARGGERPSAVRWHLLPMAGATGAMIVGAF